MANRPVVVLPKGHPTNLSPGCQKLLKAMDEGHRRVLEEKDKTFAEAKENWLAVIHNHRLLAFGVITAFLTFIGFEKFAG